MNKFIKASNERKHIMGASQKIIKLVNNELDASLNTFLNKHSQIIEDFKEYIDTTGNSWEEDIHKSSDSNEKIVEHSTYILTIDRGDLLDDAVLRISAWWNDAWWTEEANNEKDSHISFETFTEVAFDYFPKSSHKAHDDLDEALDRLFNMTQS